MPNELRPRGRPPGQHRQRAASWANGNGQFTMSAMARTLGLSMRDANNTLARLREAGMVQVAGQMRTPEAKRPVAVYEAVRDAPPGASSAFDLTRLWA